MKCMLTFFLVFVLGSCAQEYTDELFKLHPRMTEDLLLKHGYERVWGIDVLMYEKRRDNITMQYQFYDDKGQEVGYQIWVYEELLFRDNAEYKEKLKALGFVPMTEVVHSERVALRNNKTHGIYLSIWDPLKGKLSITYQHPVSE